MFTRHPKPVIKIGSLSVFADHYVLANRKFPIAGAHAEVVVAGAVTSRVTATRAVALGPLALAARKTSDKRKPVLMISGNLYDGEPHLGNTYTVTPELEIQARKVAAVINRLAEEAQR